MKLTFPAWNLCAGPTPETARGCAATTTGACRILLAACTVLAAAGCAAGQSAASVGCPLEDTVPVLGAPQLERAYGEAPMLARGINGTGGSAAIVMPYLNPNLRHDLTVYSRRYHLPAPQLTMVDWHRAPAADLSDSFQADAIFEGDADVEMIHAMAPGARLIYVQTPDTPPDSPEAWASGVWAGPNLTSALQWLAASPLHPDVISFSEAIPELDIRQDAASDGVPGQEALSAARAGIKAAARAGITVVAGVGDSGGGEPEWPASDPLVTAVGGTELHVNAAGERLGPDTADAAGCGIAAGGGLSTAFGRPSWQNGVTSVTGASRGIPDVSMDASPRTPVQVYDTGSESGWLRASGTSIAAPLFAGLATDAAALAGHPLGQLGRVLYQMDSTTDGLQDVTSGTTALPGTSVGYPARAGYDLAAGVGTVTNAALFTAALARQASIRNCFSR
jgi:subtilase family serine protease